MSETAFNTDPEWLELVLENASDAIAIIDSSRTIRYANRAAAGLAQSADAEELRGRSYDEILAQHDIYDEHGTPFSPEDFPSNRALAIGATTRNKVLRHVHRRSGTQRWLSISSIPLFVDATSRRARFAIVFFTDISDRKTREDRVQFLIESSKILSVTSDLRARLLEKSRLVVPLMADWCTVNLVAEDGNLERLAVVHRDSDKSALVARLAKAAGSANKMREVVRTGKPILLAHLSQESLGATFPGQEGQELLAKLRPTSSMILPIISGGRVLGALSLAYTDSGRIYSADDLDFMQEFCHHLGVLVDNARLYQEIEKRDKAKDDFIAALSHELRNPLAPIKSSLELLSLRANDPDIKDGLDTVASQFDHINELLRDLLDVARFTRGGISLKKELFDLRELIERTAQVNDPFLGEKRRGLHIALPPYPLPILADRTRIRQALMNILHNAEKFTPEGGNVWIEARREHDRALVSIRDDGEGIAPEELQSLFDPYARARSPHKAASGGLGLGLVLVREIAKLHGGAVRAASDGIGAGSTFELELPLESDAQHALPLPTRPKTASEGPTHKVLIVDDNEAAAKGLSTLLQHFGHTTALAGRGGDVLSAMDSFEATAILLDIGLPDMSGYDVARAVRERFGKKHLLIALTGYGQEDDVRAAHEAGFNYHLTKPVGIADIQALLTH